jgi:Tol biopolymer transport system component
MTLTAGTRLGPYEVLAPLGAGGMGEVYKARDTRLERTVAIKVLPEHLSATPDLRTRFEREARAVSSLNHPHICTLYDIGHQDGVDYLVMEHIEGETLAARLERGPLPTADVLRYAAEIADALDKAHRQGMVHRDLKPSNVMLTKSGSKLLDFGLARVMGPGGPAAGGGSGSGPAVLSQTPTMSQPLTAAGMIVGTFQYMAPEQLEGKEADARSDIWAFGATVYEMATAKHAFEGSSQASLIASILKESPRPIAELQPLTPPGLDRVVERCLAKDPDDRWQSARDLAHELQWIAQAGSKAGVAAPVAARRRSRGRLIAALALVSTLGMIAFAVLYMLRAPAPPKTVRFEIRTATAVQSQDAPRISPDGRTLAWTAVDSTGTSRIWVRALAATSAQPLPGTEGIVQRPFWSPDSRFLGFFAGGKLKKIPVTGGPAATICDAPNGSDGAWSPRGVILYDGGSTDPIRRVSAGGGVPVTAVPLDSVNNIGVGWPFFLPDGRHFLYMILGTRQALCVGTLDSKESRELGPCDSRAEYAPPGYVLFARGGALVAQPFDLRGLKFKGDPAPITESIRTQPFGGADFSVSQDGVLTYASGSLQSGRLIWVDRQGRELETVPTTSLVNVLNLALSPDGRKVAVRTLEAQSRNRDVWVIDLVRSVSSRFTFDAGNENHPLWSPDGTKILYWSDNPNASGMILKNASGAGEADTLLRSKEETIVTDWSRDGRFIVYSQTHGTGNSELNYLPMTGDRKPQVFQRGQFNYGSGVLSSDSRWLAYVSDESGKPEVYVQTFPDHGGKWQISTDGGVEPRWSANGKELFFLSADQRMMSATVRTSPGFEADVPKTLFAARVLFPGRVVRAHYGVSADGSRFLLVAPLVNEAAATQVVLNWAADLDRK